MAVIDFHYMFMSPPCRAVMILAKQLDIELNLINVDLFAGGQKTAEYEAINPRKQVPAINDNGFFLGESKAINMYLVNQYSPGNKLYPSDPKKRAEVDRALFMVAELYEKFRGISKPVFMEKKWPVADEPKEAYYELLKSLDVLIKDRKFLAGSEMTIADISYICDLTVVTDVFKIDVSTVAPNVAAWKERMKSTLAQYDEFIETPLVGFREFVSKLVGQEI